jgi:LysR family hydrogen peroxide-inducible transcriptional activator
MELTQLRYVLAIAETGNFTRAAKASNVAQPSLSQQVAKLEDELDHKLFHRLGRRAVPTEAGEVFIERARRILFEVDNASREIRDDPQLNRTITIGAIPTVAPYLLPDLIECCQQQLPNLRIHTEEAFLTDLLRDVSHGRLDLAIVAQPVREPQLAAETLFTEKLMLAVGHRHRLAAKKRITITDLTEETFIMLGESSTLTRQIQRFCGANNFQPRIGHTCAQVANLKELVALGLGIAILPQLAQHSSDRDRLSYRQLQGHNPTRKLAVVRHLQRYQTSGATRFLDLLRETFRSLSLNLQEG